MKQSFLSICAIIKEEEPYIKEWIEFHRLQGVDQFFLYHNDTIEKSIELLRMGLGSNVEVIHFPGEVKQLEAYKHCIENFGSTTIWLALIDADEFLYSPKGKLSTALSTFDFANCVLAHWVLFGSNHHVEKTDQLVIERFTARDSKVNGHVKSIIKPMFFGRCGNDPHRFEIRGRTVNERGDKITDDSPVQPNPTANVFRINHYHVKSIEEYRTRCERGRADTKVKRDFATSFTAHNTNDVHDSYLADTYAQQIKDKLCIR